MKHFQSAPACMADSLARLYFFDTRLYYHEYNDAEASKQQPRLTRFLIRYASSHSIDKWTCVHLQNALLASELAAHKIVNRVRKRAQELRGTTKTQDAYRQQVWNCLCDYANVFIDSHIEVKKDSYGGIGVFARCDIKKGVTLEQLVGELTLCTAADQKALKKRNANVSLVNYDSTDEKTNQGGSLQLSVRDRICGTRRILTGPLSFLNHDERNENVLQHKVVNHEDRLTWRAGTTWRLIHAGEELKLHYTDDALAESGTTSVE